MEVTELIIIILVQADLQCVICPIWKVKIFRFISVYDDLNVTYYSLSHAKHTCIFEEELHNYNSLTETLQSQALFLFTSCLCKK